MKVNFNTKNQLQITQILSGETFTTLRSDNKSMGIYLKIDSNNNTPFVRSRGVQFCYAVNLETGQIREFPRDKVVTSIRAEVRVVS